MIGNELYVYKCEVYVFLFFMNVIIDSGPGLRKSEEYGPMYLNRETGFLRNSICD